MQTVAVEMQQVVDEAEAADEPRIQGRALTALSEMTLYRKADADEARALIEKADEVLKDDDDVDARFDVYAAAGLIASWRSDFAEVERIGHEALAFVRAAGRKDLEAIVIQAVAQNAIISLDVVEAETLAGQATELAEASGSVRARAAALGTSAWLSEIQGRYSEAERCYRELIQLYTDIGHSPGVGSAQMYLGRLLQASGRGDEAEAILRESVRALKRVGDRGHLCEAQRFLSQTLVARGKVDEAERLALQAIETVGPEDQLSIWTTRMALGVVRAAQGRDAEAEQLLRDSVERIRPERPEVCRAPGARPACSVPLARAVGRTKRGRRKSAPRSSRPPWRSSAQQHLLDRLTRLLVGRFRDDGRRPFELRERIPQRLRAQRAFAVGEMLGLVAVSELDVAEVDVERSACLEYGVRLCERLREWLDGEERSVRRRVHVREVEDGTDPAEAPRDLDHVVRGSELAHASHHLDAERHAAVFLLQPRA